MVIKKKQKSGVLTGAVYQWSAGAMLELKSEFKQSVDRAINQDKIIRLPKNPQTLTAVHFHMRRSSVDDGAVSCQSGVGQRVCAGGV